MNKKSFLFLFILLLALAGGYYYFFVKPKSAAAQTPPQGMMMAPEVNVITVKKEPVQTYRELPARVAAYRIAEVRPQVEGVIRERKFEEGSLVNKGDALYQIDATVYDIALKNTKTSFDRMRARRDRYRALLKEDAISKQEFEDSQADFTKAEADYNIALNNANYAKILAPISGFVGKSNVTEGALVTANQTTILTTITQLDPIFVDMIQPSKESTKSKVEKNTAVSISIDDEKYEHVGALKLTERFADEGTDSVRLRAEFANPDGKLIPGMFVNAKIHLPVFESITVPQRVTGRAPNGSLFVFVVTEGNIVKQRMIKVSQAAEDRWIVTEGLEDGEVVVFDGLQKIADGAKVKIAAPAEAPSNPETKK